MFNLQGQKNNENIYILDILIYDLDTLDSSLALDNIHWYTVSYRLALDTSANGLALLPKDANRFL